jgi:hypothetical protein
MTINQNLGFFPYLCPKMPKHVPHPGFATMEPVLSYIYLS